MAKDTLLLGVDVGTTGAKAAVATSAGKLVAPGSHSRNFHRGSLR